MGNTHTNKRKVIELVVFFVLAAICTHQAILFFRKDGAKDRSSEETPPSEQTVQTPTPAPPTPEPTPVESEPEEQRVQVPGRSLLGDARHGMLENTLNAIADRESFPWEEPQPTPQGPPPTPFTPEETPKAPAQPPLLMDEPILEPSPRHGLNAEQLAEMTRVRNRSTNPKIPPPAFSVSAVGRGPAGTYVIAENQLVEIGGSLSGKESHPRAWKLVAADQSETVWEPVE